ncbi:MAG: type I DNA topoisomerase [Candidatus Paceibacterota bacterium]|jgi:DNA topoisomerase-1
MKLVIVESPTKATTISKFLGSDYKVESSYGHIRDLPKSKLGVDLEKDFEPQYIIPTKSKKRVTFLKKESQKADKIILATDEDREGEAIAWHLTQALGLENEELRIKNSEPIKVERIVFHEITKPAIEEALKTPRSIDLNMVNAQQGRRVLDRLVGYKLSPFLWAKIMKRLSAGRVQSVALRLIVEREDEIRNFKPDEYWTIETLLQPKNKKTQFLANLSEINDKPIPKLGIKTKDEAEKIAKDLEKCDLKILTIEKKEIFKNPPTPFTTSSLQQASANRLGYSAKQTMRLAQGLYEKGLITYMRTDSLNLSKDSVLATKNWIEKNFGEKYASQAPRFFKTKSKTAQEAHEAIRPTRPDLTGQDFKSESKQETKLYDLIWRRFIASQLPQAIFDSTKIEIEAKNKNSYKLQTNGSMLRFDGFLKVWQTKFEEKSLPELSENEKLDLVEVKPDQHFTEPPARYNEASLIKILEKYGIGRPSTYAPTISVIQDRNYVIKNESRQFVPTEIGEAVNKLLVAHFPEIVDISFTAKMEEELDEIAEGKIEWKKVIREFYEPFIKNLEAKINIVEKVELTEEKIDKACDLCGKPMIVKYGRFGKFLACSGFPECKNTKSYSDSIDLGPCPKCKEGKVVMRRTKKRRMFYGCSIWPKCDFISWKKPGTETEGQKIEE